MLMIPGALARPLMVAERPVMYNPGQVRSEVPIISHLQLMIELHVVRKGERTKDKGAAAARSRKPSPLEQSISLMPQELAVATHLHSPLCHSCTLLKFPEVHVLGHTGSHHNRLCISDCDVSTLTPHLWSLLGIPPPRQQVFPCR